MIVLAGSWRIPAEKLALAQPFFEFMLERTRAEAGCLTCTYALDVLEPGLIRNYLVFRDKDALLHHRKSSYVSEDWRQFVQDFSVTEFNVDQYDVPASVKADWEKLDL